MTAATDRRRLQLVPAFERPRRTLPPRAGYELALYPPFLLLVIVATGNHFLLDTAAGALVVGLAAAPAARLTRRPATARLVLGRG